MNCIQNQVTTRDRVLIRDKVAGFIVIGGQDNVQAVAGQMLGFFAELGFLFPQFPYVAHSRGWTAEDMEKNVDVLRTSHELRDGVAALVERCTVLAGAPDGLGARARARRARRPQGARASRPSPRAGARMIEVDGLTRRYGGTVGRRPTSPSAWSAGELLALVGDSGSGKTTTLKMINRLVEPNAGRVLVEGRDAAAVEPHALRRSIGYVFQGMGLFPHMTVAENVARAAAPRRVAARPRRGARRRAAARSSSSTRRSGRAARPSSPGASSSAWASRARSPPRRA